MAVQSSSSRAEREAHYASCKYEFLIVSFLYYFICKKTEISAVTVDFVTNDMFHAEILD